MPNLLRAASMLLVMLSPLAALAATPSPARLPAELAGDDAAGDNAAARRGEPGEPGEDAPVRRARAWAPIAPTVVVSATRAERDAFNTPSTVDIVSNHDLVRRQVVRTVPEALEEVPGVLVQKTGHGQGSPFIRGFTGYQTLMLIDGVRLNNSTFRAGPNQYWATVDPWSLERLEVVKGTGSALHGSDAIGGTVNAVTLSPPPRDPDADGPNADGPNADGMDLYGRLFYRFASAERSHITRLEAGGWLDEHMAFVAGANYKYFGDIEAGGSTGRLPRTGYEEWDGDIKLIYNFTDKTNVVFYHSQVHQKNAWRVHKTVYAVPFADSERGDELKRILDQDRQLTYLQLNSTDRGGIFDAVHATLSWQQQKEKRHRIRGNGRIDDQGVDVGTFGASLQLETPGKIGRWTYGFDYYHDNVNSFRQDWNADGSFRGQSIQGPVADDATYDLFGAFVQNEIALCDRADLILGGRYTHAGLVARDVEDPESGEKISIADDWEAFTGSARVIYRVTDQVHLFGGVSQGFRAPNLSDLTRLDTARSGEIETPVPGGLDPERYTLYEGGVKVRSEKFAAQAVYFFTDIEDMIVRSPTGDMVEGLTEVTKTNTGDGYVHGVELAGSVRVHPQFTLFGNFTWMDGEVKVYPTSGTITRSEPLDRLMPPTGLLGVRWNHPEKDHWVELAANFAADADDLSTRDKEDTQRIPPGGTPGYIVVHLRSGWQITDDLNVTVGLENLTNENYRVHGSGQNEPGISLVIGADWRF